MKISDNNDQLAKIYLQLTTGKKINSAADDAAGLAISEKILSQTNGYDVGSNNSRDMQNLIKTAEGGLENIGDSLQRIRELSVQAQNGIYTDSDKEIMQHEVSSLLKGIKDSVQGTQFNTMKLLDGSFANKNTASNPSGVGMQISIANTSLESLGIADFDLTKEFDISAIDNAISKVSEGRSKIGAQHNALTYTINSNETASLNLKAANSRIADTDMAKAIIALKGAQIREQYKTYMQKDMMSKQNSFLNLLG